ncbi:MAG: 4-(cytidine 5'-diphospho)-2-C-methyl-D-erythritol kinase [Salibacteraceae bacterium]
MIKFPGCKINIGLNIVSKRNDGFHNLESIFYPIKWTDVLEVYPSTKTTLTVTGTDLQIPKEDNIVWKALQLIKADYSIPNIEIILLKNLPNGAGLGGGSANGSAMINLLNEQFELNIPIQKRLEYASTLGSDCPFFIQPQPTFVTGRGENLRPIQLDLSKFKILIVNPGIHVSTPVAFAGIKPEKSNFNLSSLTKNTLPNWQSIVKNDFENTVFKAQPQIQELKELILSKNPIYASMSGTGSSVYGIFKELPNLNEFKKENWSIYSGEL